MMWIEYGLASNHGLAIGRESVPDQMRRSEVMFHDAVVSAACAIELMKWGAC
jgi:hypothetical protein